MTLCAHTVGIILGILSIHRSRLSRLTIELNLRLADDTTSKASKKPGNKTSFCSMVVSGIELGCAHSPKVVCWSSIPAT